MEIVRKNINEITFIDDLVIATGYFDGVHNGHKILIDKAFASARAKGYKSGVLTFAHKPIDIIMNNTKPSNITTIENRAHVIEEMGIDYLIVLEASRNDLINIDKTNFVTNVLLKMGAKGIICGEDYRFAKKASGKPSDIIELSDGKITVDVMPLLMLNGHKVGTTEIKNLLEKNDLDAAKVLLGRSYSVTGVVESGRQLGRKIDFPTANLYISETVYIPISGVFAGTVEVNNRKYYAIINVGKNPTVNNSQSEKILEAHILNFTDDIYGEHISVTFDKFIRGEKKFSSVTELKEQLKIDLEFAKKFYRI